MTGSVTATTEPSEPATASTATARPATEPAAEAAVGAGAGTVAVGPGRVAGGERDDDLVARGEPAQDLRLAAGHQPGRHHLLRLLAVRLDRHDRLAVRLRHCRRRHVQYVRQLVVDDVDLHRVAREEARRRTAHGDD